VTEAHPIGSQTVRRTTDLPGMTTAVATLRQPTARWAGLAVDFAARSTVAALLMLLFWTLAPMIMGWQSYVIMSGSMAPRLFPGDVVLSQPMGADKVSLGQIILMDNPARAGTTLVHRAVGRNPDGSLVTRGDANAAEDSTPVPAELVRGLPRLRVPYVGLPAVWLANGDYRSLGLSLVAGTVLMVGVRRRPPELMSQPGRTRADRGTDNDTNGGTYANHAPQQEPGRHRRGPRGRHADHRQHGLQRLLRGILRHHHQPR
jgi:signal peptidase